MDFYVYYQVEENHAHALHARVKKMQQNLRTVFCVQAALKRRPTTFDNMQTWMEIYLTVPVGFDEILERTAKEYDVSPLINAGRHTEQFMDFEA